MPPGPPVLQTIVAEIYGPDYGNRLRLPGGCANCLKTPGVVDVDWYVESDQPQLVFRFEQEKAALHQVSADRWRRSCRLPGQAPKPAAALISEDEDVPIRVRLPLSQRAQPGALLCSDLLGYAVCAAGRGHEHRGPLGESIYRKICCRWCT